MTGKIHAITVKLPVADLNRIPGNRSAFIRRAVAEKLQRESGEWKPDSDLGRTLVSLKARYVREGGQLLDDEAIQAELRERRGGPHD